MRKTAIFRKKNIFFYDFLFFFGYLWHTISVSDNRYKKTRKGCKHPGGNMMVENQNMIRNLVKARGRVVGFGRDFQGRNEIYIFMRQEYQARPVQVAFLFRNIDPEIQIGDFVEIEGHVMAYYRQAANFEQTGKRTYAQSFVATSIKFCKTEIEEVFGIEGGFARKPMIRCYYSGEVTRIDFTKGRVRDANDRRKTREVTFVNLLVKIPSNNVTRRLNIVTAQYTERMRTSDINVEVGDTVAIVANVTSTKKTFPNQEKPVFFTNLQIDDMVIIEKGEKPEEAVAKTEAPEVEAPKETQAPSEEKNVDAPTPEQKPEATTPAVEKAQVEEVQEVQPEKKNEDFKLEEEAEDIPEDTPATSEDSSGEKVDSSDAVFNEFLNN